MSWSLSMISHQPLWNHSELPIWFIKELSTSRKITSTGTTTNPGSHHFLRRSRRSQPRTACRRPRQFSPGPKGPRPAGPKSGAASHRPLWFLDLQGSGASHIMYQHRCIPEMKIHGYLDIWIIMNEDGWEDLWIDTHHYYDSCSWLSAPLQSIYDYICIRIISYTIIIVNIHIYIYILIYL